MIMMIIIVIIMMTIIGRAFRRCALVAFGHRLQEDAHPGRERRHPVEKVRSERLSRHGIVEQLAKLATHPVGLALAR